MRTMRGMHREATKPSGDTRLEPDPAEVLRWYVPHVPMMSAESAQSAMCDTREDG